MTRIVILLLVTGMLGREALADLSACVDATCRVYGATGAVGTGCTFDETGEEYLVLTNAHVVGQGEGGEVACEFWRNGYSLGRVKAQVVREWRSASPSRDIAIVAVSKKNLSEAAAIVPLGPRGVSLESRTVLSVGCAMAKWPTAWKGHVLEADGGIVSFVPTPADGRSGSALFNEDGSMIVGLVTWRSADNAYGIAMHLGEIYAAFDGQTTSPLLSHETGAGGIQLVQHPSAPACVHGVSLTQFCPDCRDSDRTLPLAPFSQQEPRGGERKLFGDGAYQPWSGARGSGRGSGSGGALGSPPPDLSSFASKAELTAVESRLTHSIQKVQQQLDKLEGQTQTALTQTQQTSAQLDVQKKSSETTRESIFKRLEEFASREELIAKYEEARLAGADAGREAARRVALAVIAEKLGEPAAGALWNSLIAALGISGPIGIGLIALGWLVRRRLSRRITTRLRGGGEAPRSEPFRGNAAGPSDRG